MWVRLLHGGPKEHMTKPRIIKRHGSWLVTMWWHKTGDGRILYIPLGLGETPAKAWEKAFPKTWLGKLANTFRLPEMWSEVAK